jgi:histidine triad (HIT) family protein
MKGKKHPVLDALQKAAKGLQYTSETEAKLEPFLWEDGDKLTDDRLLELAGEEEGTAVEQQSLDDFFHAVPPEDKEKFSKLAKVLQEQLSGVKVYKVGDEPEKQVYIIGKTTDRKWAGLKTTVVET